MIELVPLDRFNWEECLGIKLTPEQETYVPSVLYSLAQANFENLYPFGIRRQDEMVGLIMYGDFGDICWINRVMVDKAHQHEGIGRAAVEMLVHRLQARISCKEIRATYIKGNEVAARMFASAGFRDSMPDLEGEVVVRYSN